MNERELLIPPELWEILQRWRARGGFGRIVLSLEAGEVRHVEEQSTTRIKAKVAILAAAKSH